MLRSKFRSLLLLSALVFLAFALGPKQEFSHNGEIMGTTFTVKWLDSRLAGFSSRSLRRNIDLRLSKVDGLMSTYKADSELSRFNSVRDSHWFSVSSETMEVLVEAKYIYEMTDGAFDPTVGPLVELWGFGSSGGVTKPPSAEEVREHLRMVGFSKLELDPASSRIRKIEKHLQVDLSAIAKGFAVDQVAALLNQRGLSRYMVEIGGEVRVSGSSKNGEGWKIAVLRPVSGIANGQKETQRVLELRNSAMATSGTYRNFFKLSSNESYSHTINPKTGYPIEHKTISVSVLDPSCMRADGIATALLVLGSKRAKSIIAREKLAVLLYDSGVEKVVEFESSSLKDGLWANR